MELKYTKVEVGKSKPQKTFTKEVFKYYFEELKYTRRDFTEKLGVNHRIFTYGLKAYYTQERIEELRRAKIVSGNILGSIKKWDKHIPFMEKFIPGFSELFKENIKENPELLMKEIIKVNDDFYKFKISLKPIKKYINQAIKRKGGISMRLVGNGLEARVKSVLDELDIIYECQFPLGKYYYDFRVRNTLIEADGKQYHNNIVKDIKKEKFAIKKGFKVIRLDERLITKEPIKLRKCLRQLK